MAAVGRQRPVRLATIDSTCLSRHRSYPHTLDLLLLKRGTQICIQPYDIWPIQRLRFLFFLLRNPNFFSNTILFQRSAISPA